MAVIIRPATPEDAPGLAYVRVTTWRAAYVGLIPDDYLNTLDVDHEATRWREGLGQLEAGGRCGFMAVEQAGEPGSGRVVGYAIAGPERTGDAEYPAELYALYVLPEYQGQGLGRRLVQAAGGWLRERGYGRMIIYVLRSNTPSRRFYEAIGGALARDKEVEIGGTPMAEMGYGYDLLNSTFR